MAKPTGFFDDAASVYFMAGILAFTALLLSFWAVGRVLRHRRTRKVVSRRLAACSCPACVSKAAVARRAGISAGPSRLVTTVAVVLCATAWVATAVVFARAMESAKATAGQKPEWNPYKILGVEEGASEQEINKAFRRLSLKWHPDKNLNNKEEAEKMFVQISKAQEALTSEVTRKNYEMYGNPDGPQETKVGIALPSWLLAKKNSKYVLLFYVVGFLVLIPGAAIYFSNKWKKLAPNEVRFESMGLFNKYVVERMSVKTLADIIGASIEYSEMIRVRSTDQEMMPKLMKLCPSSRKPASRFNVPWAQKTWFATAFFFSILIYSHISRLHSEMTPDLQEDAMRIAKLAPVLIGGVCTIAQMRGFLSPIIEALQFQQMIVQATWPEHPLMQLPHFTMEMVEACDKKRWGNIENPQHFARVGGQMRERLIDELELTPQQMADIDAVLDSTFRKSLNVTAVAKVDDSAEVISCRSIATLFVTASFTTYHTRITDDTAAAADNGYVPSKPHKRRTAAAAATTAQSQAPAQEESAADGKEQPKADEVKEKKAAEVGDDLIHAPYIPDERTESWWLVLGDPMKNRVEGMTKVTIPSTEGAAPSEHKIQFLAPNEVGEYNWMLFAISDSYIGRDVKVPVKFRVVAAAAAEKVEASQPTVIDDEDEDDYDSNLDEELTSESEEEEETRQRGKGKGKGKKARCDSCSGSDHSD